MLSNELTPLEMERLGLLCIGVDYRGIAALTGLTEHTVKNAFKLMFLKTGTSDGLELAVRFAWELMERYHSGDGPVPASFPKRVTVNGLCVFESRRGHLITPVIYPPCLSEASLPSEDICESL